MTTAPSKFSTKIVLLAEKLPKGFLIEEIGSRMVEASEAVDGNLLAADKSNIQPDEIRFLERALGKTNETLAWLDNLYESAIIDKLFYRKLAGECEMMVAKISARMKKEWK